MDRIFAGLCALLMHPRRVARSAIILKPSTILGFHRSLVKRKYRLLLSPLHRGKPGPKGPSKELIDAIVAMKQRNPSWGCPRPFDTSVLELRSRSAESVSSMVGQPPDTRYYGGKNGPLRSTLTGLCFILHLLVAIQRKCWFELSCTILAAHILSAVCH